MKIEGDSKMTDSEMHEGEYSDEDLNCMLEHFIKAKEIEKDPAKLKMLKDFALSKSKDIQNVFATAQEKPKAYSSIDDLKKKKAELDSEDLEESEG